MAKSKKAFMHFSLTLGSAFHFTPNNSCRVGRVFALILEQFLCWEHTMVFELEIGFLWFNVLRECHLRKIAYAIVQHF